jgi:hypothetical protein
MRNAVTVARPVRRDSLALPDRRVEQLRAIHKDMPGRRPFRQINEFSISYDEKKRKGLFLAFSLIFYSALCLVLFIFNVNVIAFFSVGSLLILIQLFQCGLEVLEEGARTQRAYHLYLSGLSLPVLFHLRKTATLSAWSKYEIDRFLQSIL